MTRDNSNDHGPVLHRYQLLIGERLTDLSTAEQMVASHLAAHPDQVPFETAGSIAKRLGVSSMTVGRALKALGYRGLGDLRAEMRTETPAAHAAPWRSAAAASAPALDDLERARSMRAEMEAVAAVHALAESPPWEDAVARIASADRVFVAGFQTERGLAIAFADHLSYVRPGIHYLSADNRAFADLLAEGSDRSCLVIVDCRRYSRWFRLLARKAAELSVPLVIVTDPHCHWASEYTRLVFQVRTDSGRFWDNNAPISSLLNLLVEDVIERLGESVHARLDAASEFGALFVGFDRVHRHRRSKKGEPD